MDTAALRAELTDFYWNHIDDRAAAFRDRVFPLLDQRWQPDMTACQRKAMQYETIAERCECVLFHQSPFYYELGAMQHLCDGAGYFIRAFRREMGVTPETYRAERLRK